MDKYLGFLDLPNLSKTLVERACFALIVLIIGYVVIRILIKIEKKILKKSVIDPSVHVLITRITRFLLWLLLVMVILQALNVSTGPFIAVLGAAGAAIALALKDSLGNVAGGIILVMNKPFVAGDEIEVNGITGIVDHIDIMTTYLHTYDNEAVIIPNGVITNSVITNATDNNIRRVRALFSVSYDADLRLARKTIRRVIEENPMMQTDPEPMILLIEHGDSGLLFDVGVWCQTSDRFAAKDQLIEQVKVAFDQAGIEIPYPVVDVRVNSNPNIA